MRTELLLVADNGMAGKTSQACVVAESMDDSLKDAHGSAVVGDEIKSADGGDPALRSSITALRCLRL